MKLLNGFLFTFLLLGYLSQFSFAAGRVGPTDLRCEHLINPLGIDAEHPRLSWRIDDKTQEAGQSAYNLIVGLDSLKVLQGTGDFWETGKLTTPAMLVSYSGPKLNRFSKYFWRVEIWDKSDRKSVSGVSSFETGMMGNGSWKGNWISDGQSMDTRPAPYFRKAFSTDKKVRSARVYIAVAGLYELYMNGTKIGNHRLDPVYTRYDRRNVYVTYDVTSQLRNRGNAIGVLLGNGWYNHQPLAVWHFDKAPWRNRPAFCLDLRITYEDGTTQTIATGLDWKSSTGSILSNNIYTGEHYDARKEQAGWNTADFDDSRWGGVSLRSAPSHNIVAQSLHPIRNVEAIQPKSVRKFNDSTWIFDLGRNIAGVAEIRVRGEAGTVLKLTHGERLKSDGRLDMSNIDIYYTPKDNTDPFQTDFFILKGQGNETFMPRFNYKGFQYVEVTSNKPVQFTQESLTGYFMHSDVPVAGRIHSSDELINKIWSASNNSYLSNLYGYPTDCPQREKNGWTGDGHFAIESGLYNFDAITIYEKWLADHRDEQQPNGVLPDIVPTGGWGYGTANGTDWTSTIAIIPWNIYLFYGDSQLLKDCYENIKRYVNYVESISPEGLTSWGRGDWVPVKSHSSLELTSSVYYYTDALILSKAARLFGKTEDEKYYSALAERIKGAINQKYFNANEGIYASGTQTELSVPLYWGVVPDEYKAKVAFNLAKKVEQSNFHLDVGVLGAKAILNALSENGQAETAWKLARQDTYPSWGWWIVNGATTLYENWNIKAERDISLNHMMFGEISAWLYKGLGGIRPDPQAPGFKNILLEPNFPEGLNEFSAEHDGPYGTIRSSWRRSGKKITIHITVPANSTATFRIDAAHGKSIYTDGKPLKTDSKVWYAGSVDGKESYRLTSGIYKLELR